MRRQHPSRLMKQRSQVLERFFKFIHSHVISLLYYHILINYWFYKILISKLLFLISYFYLFLSHKDCGGNWSSEDGVPALQVALEALFFSASSLSSPAAPVQYGSSTHPFSFLSSTREGGVGFLQFAIEAFSRLSANLTSPLSLLQLGSSTQCLWINSSLSKETAIFIGFT